MNEKVCMYLRKSRKDEEAEMLGEGETLARHERMLLDTAKKLNLTVGAIYREIVSGDSISARPKMQQLLTEVESGMWDAVMVVEVERLARGDTIDQGIVQRAFQITNTKIITPNRTYDPGSEADQEYFEFGLFMSRREYQTIKRRMQAGRVASVKEGKYCANKPPYGYKRVKLERQKGFTLEIIPEQAAVVRLVFDLYLNGENGRRMGTVLIAQKLNEMHIETYTGGKWVPASIRCILDNPVYKGKIRWGRRKCVSTIKNGVVTKERPRAKEYLLCDGMHEPIISEEIYDKVAEMRSKNPITRMNKKYEVKNSLSGLVICKGCGHTMTRHLYDKGKEPRMYCTYRCGNVSTEYNLLEEVLIKNLKEIINKYKTNADCENQIAAEDNTSDLIKTMQKELEKLNVQKNKLYDFLEQGIYDTDTFLSRQKSLSAKIEDLEEEISKMQKDQAEKDQEIATRKEFIPKCERILEGYFDLEPAERNKVLKEIVTKVIYEKTSKNNRGCGKDANFKLDIFLRLS